jgi:large subunit ribosomal protein L21
MEYAIIKLGNKQHRVRDGETLVVDRLPTEAGKTFEPVVLLGDEKVTATIVAHERGPKLLIGKYRRRTGYKRHNGFRAATSRVEITIGAGNKRAASKSSKPAEHEKVEAAAEAQHEAHAHHGHKAPAHVTPTLVPTTHEAPVDAPEADEAAGETPDVEASNVETAVPETAVPETAAPETAELETVEGEEAGPAKAEAVPEGLPDGYEDLTVAQVHTETKGWSVEELEAALAFEQEHAARKGAISALESALKQDEAEDGA